jgi:hypothetical protein
VVRMPVDDLKKAEMGVGFFFLRSFSLAATVCERVAVVCSLRADGPPAADRAGVGAGAGAGVGMGRGSVTGGAGDGAAAVVRGGAPLSPCALRILRDNFRLLPSPPILLKKNGV